VIVAEGQPVGQGSAVLWMTRLNDPTMTIDARLPPQEAARLTLGQQATITIGSQGTILKGRVSDIQTAAVASQRVGLPAPPPAERDYVTVTVAPDRVPPDVPAGSRVTVEFHVPKRLGLSW
jgi:hypothetical protein